MYDAQDGVRRKCVAARRRASLALTRRARADNQITDDGGLALADAIRANKSSGGVLETLDFEKNRMTIAGEEALAAAFVSGGLETNQYTPAAVVDKVKALREQDTSQQDAAEKSQAALDLVMNAEFARLLTDVQHAIWAALIAARAADVETGYDEALAIAEAESQWLGGLVVSCMVAYKTAGLRIEPLLALDARATPKQATPPSLGDAADLKVRYLLARAAREDPAFRGDLIGLVERFNACATTEEACAKFGLDASEFALELPSAVFRLDKQRPGMLVRVKFGPPKDYARAIQKNPDWLMDLCRCTLEFEDPYAHYLFFRVLDKQLNVVGVDNHLNQTARPPVLQLYVARGDDGFLCEVMLMFSKILEIKKYMHKPYDILRSAKEQGGDGATDLSVLKPRFGPPKLPDVAPAVGDETAALKAEIAAKDAQLAEKDAENAALKAALEGAGLSLPPAPPRH